MPTRNFNTPLLDIKKKPIKQSDAADSTVVTLGDIVCDALLKPLPTDADLTGKEKINICSLAERIAENLTTFTVDELTLIKQRVEKHNTILAYARVCALVDAEPEPTEPPAAPSTP